MGKRGKEKAWCMAIKDVSLSFTVVKQVYFFFSFFTNIAYGKFQVRLCRKLMEYTSETKRSSVVITGRTE